MSSVDALGPGTPMPATYTARPIGVGQRLQYHAKAGEIAADVGHSGQGSNINAQFSPRPPTRPPGTSGIGDKGSFVDKRA